MRPGDGSVDGGTLLSRLIGLAREDPEARTGLDTSSTGTLMLPLSLSQRVSAAHVDELQRAMPQLRNAIRSASPHADSTPTEEQMNTCGLDTDGFPSRLIRA